MASPHVKETLESLVAATVRVIEQGLSNGSLAPSEQVYFRFRLEGDLKYTERGVDLPPARGETSTRPSWAIAVATVVQGQVLQTTEFEAAVARLRDYSKIDAQVEQHLQSFVFAVAAKTFELHPHSRREAFEYLIRRFLEDVDGLPFDMSAEIELDGLALEAEKIEPTSGIMLRRPRREDFEKETPYFGPGLNPGLSFDGTISTIATIKRQGAAPRDAQLAVEKLIAMLRLFEVASVTYHSYQLAGGSLINFVGGRFTRGREAVHERIFVRSEDEPRLLRFWGELSPIIPGSFYDVSASDLDYRDMAYERYSAALVRPGYFEERVASGVMALEALLLEESLELAYKLRMRAAKLLSFFGERPVAVRDTVRDAYEVRSRFAHGGRLPSRERRKLESRYESAGGLVRTVLNLVRKVIVVTLLVDRPKGNLIGLIDDALIERSRDDELRHLLLPVAELI